jgi:transcription-repair coupling factor (superfamily II helicase)
MCCGGFVASAPPRIIVAGVRALLQRLSSEAIEIEPIRIRPNDVIDPDALLDTLIGFGYRREDLVEHRGEVARRGAIIDVFPSTADAPVRIDLWGDEVDRLTEFTVNDQRSTDDLAEVHIFPARELLPSEAVRARASALIADEPWGREQWERPGRGTVFDGMESWLPVAGRGRHLDHRSAACLGQGRVGRTSAHARPCRGSAGRGGRPGPHPCLDMGSRR